MIFKLLRNILQNRAGILPPYRQFDAHELYWEPTPCGIHGKEAEHQASGFLARADASIVWTRIPYGDFPDTGIFGKGREWLSENEIFYYAEHSGEELFLIQNTWCGFPDPLEWGLVSRVPIQADTKWKSWGFFSDLPSKWVMPPAIEFAPPVLSDKPRQLPR